MAKPRVFVTRQLPGDALQALRETADLVIWPEQLPPPAGALLAEASQSAGLLTLVTDRVDEQLLRGCPLLRVVSNMAVGYDNIDVAACTARRIPVGNTPGVLTETTADLAFALLLAAARRIAEARDYVRAGKWKTWEPGLLLGVEAHGATLGIFGMGKIGQAVARRAGAFSMKVLYCDKPRPEAELALGVQRVEKDELLKAADFVSLHVRFHPQTRHLIGARELRLMRSTAILINTSRGGVVDQAALTDALAAGRIGGAALDVTDPEPMPPDDPLLGLSNCLIVPHIGSASLKARTSMARMAVENLLAGLQGRALPHCVNPEVEVRKSPRPS
jgi:glyoxylate reductase